MRRLTAPLLVFSLCGSHSSFAKPHYDQSLVPRVVEGFFTGATRISPKGLKTLSPEIIPVEILRVRIDWNESSDDYSFGHALIEKSGTPGLFLRSAHEDELGSYKGRLVSQRTGKVLAHDSIATGAHFRKLTRAISFRFPLPQEEVRLEVYGENHLSGEMEKIIDEDIVITKPDQSNARTFEPEIRVLKAAEKQPALAMNIYADGYLSAKREVFFQDAARAVEAIIGSKFAGLEHLEYRAVFQPSRLQLGSAKDLGLPVAARDSALGLYYPYWNKFGRWYNVVYPSSEEKFREEVGRVPYDYVFVLIDSSEYWGVGNYREFTAVPSRNTSFTYLVQHELGHFFGLNEEYSGGGPTELAFAPHIKEPWSQNITFLGDTTALKWRSHVSATTQMPTPRSRWTGNGPYGAYPGGYAETEPFGQSHIPGLSCTMDRASQFCAICKGALADRVKFDLGENKKTGQP